MTVYAIEMILEDVGDYGDIIVQCGMSFDRAVAKEKADSLNEKYGDNWCIVTEYDSDSDYIDFR